MSQIFTGNFTQQEPLPEASIEAAVRVMRHGRLHRYNLAEDEKGETALLEEEFAAFTGAKYCLAVASGGYALAAALRAAGAKAGDAVLTNAFTLAPVPGAIANAGCTPVFVEVTANLVMDLDDLEAKIADSGARFLMLSHMRGHIVDMDALMAICDGAGVQVIEDCAHTMGAAWNGVPSGRHGVAGCYSTQTFKHLNSGEGGFMVTDDVELAARAIMLSGSYMLYERHTAGPPAEVFEQIRLETPNCSGRMDNLRAAILRPQLRNLPDQCAAWNARYQRVESGLANTPGVTVIERPEAESYVMSSFQFLCPDFSASQMIALQQRTAARGVELKWFGADQPVGFTSRHDSWQYVTAQSLPQTDRILAGLMDMRLPLTFSLQDCDLIAQIIREEVGILHQAG
ncbi:DegT/DnrJ/EryC1/StrS family aminotransferase [Neptunicoccus cionae]|uniref:DegT/DnrJ/EryC1/StrS family aminotransferase n=1 Tax=Neptunicoccus cionae TaxID=2035344 RepID=UPI000C792EDA|nr:aminotransferase class I/II-fold pyridoxal phosphate-dependent enzyme [Amylibacter cionae]PLS22128.1 aminotransferase [Amylibacter cionae]